MYVRRLPHHSMSVSVTHWTLLVWGQCKYECDHELRGRSKLALDSVREGMPGACSVGAGPLGRKGREEELRGLWVTF